MSAHNRRRTVSRCPHCNKALKAKDGIATCDCENRIHQVISMLPERGTEDEERWLADHGFHFKEDADGDLYYVGPLGHIRGVPLVARR